MFYNLCINMVSNLSFSYNILSNGFTTMFIFGLTQELIIDLFNYFSNDYRNLICNPTSIRLSEIFNFYGIIGFILGCTSNLSSLYIYKKLIFN